MNRLSVLPLVAALALAACGDLPQPFAGRPGALAMQLSRPPPPRLLVPPPSAGLLPEHDAAALGTCGRRRAGG